MTGEDKADAESVGANYCQGFAPIRSGSDRLLILGTMPSVRSLAEAFYYAHPRNAFWPILGQCLGQADLLRADLAQASVPEKIRFLNAHHMALWDVLAACERPGSLDSAITAAEPNDFETLLAAEPGIRHILFNGRKAEQLFRRQVLAQQTLPSCLTYHALPSTSPANARLPFEKKRDFWCQTLTKVLGK
ncbi:DNA-deoxyinosine glycosylase [Hydrogenovibrio halophilus]|uniref:DNA-deoxyinosine glycosylase n=1 Tax=Hydrogenovibrio halophilus TaxID=373391 RepID=UPI000375B565|nr:DNA-deoxyinosine glycosylase [Hydrogenovibrio halophilus]